MEMKEYPGYVGVHTQDQATGAIPNGTRIVKAVAEKGDAHLIGDKATVLGSLDVLGLYAGYIPGYGDVRYFYFVEWDDKPGMAVGIMEYKIARLS